MARPSTEQAFAEPFRQRVYRNEVRRSRYGGFRNRTKKIPPNQGATTIPSIIVRLLLIIAATFGWDIWAFDINSAFTYGEIPTHLKDKIFLKMPKEAAHLFPPGTPYLKLKRSLYGLREAPTSWQNKLNETLQKAGFKQSRVFDCLFYKDQCYITTHVDDILACGHAAPLEELQQHLRDSFVITVEEQPEKYCGVTIEYDKGGGIKLHQRDKIDAIIKEFGDNELGRKYVPAPAAEKMKRASKEENKRRH